MFKEIRPDNVIMFAMKHYSNPQGDTQTEFNEDMKRFKYIKRLLRKYDDTGDLKERLILNHIIVIYNQFGQEAGTRLLFLKLEGYYPQLVPFLRILKRCPEVVPQIGLPTEDIHISKVKEDILISEILDKEIGKSNE